MMLRPSSSANLHASQVRNGISPARISESSQTPAFRNSPDLSPPPPSPSTGNNDNDNNDAINVGIGIGVDTNPIEHSTNPEHHESHHQIEDPFQHQHPQEEHQTPISPHQMHGLPLYDARLDGHGISVAQSHIDAVAAAHHGLQALQAAVAAPAVSPGPAPSHSPEPPPVHITWRVALPRLSTPHRSLAAPASKVTRLRRACDMCSQRKVKCDEKHPCRPCRDLNVECTFNREMKRRGPPNKHAEAAKAAKRPRIEPNIGVGPHHAAGTLISIAGTPGLPGIQGQQAVLDAESLAPFSILEHLVDDFFTYIHPLTPFPHEPTFRKSFINREDRTNREFLALLASMIGALAASFPRTARLHPKYKFPGNFPPLLEAVSPNLPVRSADFGVKFPR